LTCKINHFFHSVQIKDVFSIKSHPEDANTGQNDIKKCIADMKKGHLDNKNR